MTKEIIAVATSITAIIAILQFFGVDKSDILPSARPNNYYNYRVKNYNHRPSGLIDDILFKAFGGSTIKVSKSRPKAGGVESNKDDMEDINIAIMTRNLERNYRAYNTKKVDARHAIRFLPDSSVPENYQYSSYILNPEFYY